MTQPTDSQPIAVLLVEDDPGDVVLIQEAFEHNKVRNRLHVVGDGVEAMDFLRNGGDRPDLVLLDLNLPRKDGREVLEEIKTDPALRSIPVVVLTTSKAEEDILRSYDLHANAYVTKPVDFSRFIEVVRQIDEFFVTVVKLPTHERISSGSGEKAPRH
jgi:CheY-like chemotaxis protein